VALSDLELPEGLELRRDERGLALAGDGMELRGDFAHLLPRLRQDRLHRELLVRAARVRGAEAPTAVDATAGLGEDALLLAAAGFEVTLCERDPVIAALLADALARVQEDERLAEVAGRMQLVEGDAKETLASLDEAPDVVFLDPMFPERRRRASTNKKLQLFQRLERPCEDEEALMAAALAARPRKVVVKRPLKGPYLAGVKPSSSLAGKVVRYDVIVPPQNPA
jgi:16S rRNA (guanine1516-N2)-methyltransferase